MKMRGGEDAETWPEMEEIANKMSEEVETESSGSSEAETESPRSVVGRWVTDPITTTKTDKERVVQHSQVMKVREEDLCVLVEDKAAKLENRRYFHHPHPPRRRLDLFVISGRNLPCSPLSGKVRSVNAV